MSGVSGTQVSAVRVLKLLETQGFLDAGILGDTSERQLRRDTAQGIADVAANAVTPYGPVVMKMTLDDIDIDFVNPFAYMYFLCDKFRKLFQILCPGGQPTQRCIVLYIDEVRPGNPLRAGDKSRTTQCLYWVFSCLPDRFISNCDTWFLGTTVRSKIIDKVPGKVSRLMTAVINLFWSASGNSWSRGILAGHGNDVAMLSARFGGFLGDEKALKEIFSLKGAAGTRCCPSCANVVQWLECIDGGLLVGIACADRSKFVQVGDRDLYLLADQLMSHVGTKASLEALEQSLGINLHPEALIFDKHCRTIVQPVVHYLRDWMHIIVGHGIAGTETALLIHALKTVGVTNDHIIRYAGNVYFPKVLGKFDVQLFSPKYVDKDSMRVFASDMLRVLPVLDAFMCDVVVPMGHLADHAASYKLLHNMVRLLQLGPTAAAARHTEIAAVVCDHHQAYLRAYTTDDVKPKWHHALHVHEQARHLNKILSCFVTERKHKEVKSIGTWAFNKYEQTVLKGMLRKQVGALADDSVFDVEAMVQPQFHRLKDVSIERATAARLPCGQISRGDIVACWPRSVAQVVVFVSSPGLPGIFVQATRFVATGSLTDWVRQDTVCECFPASHIVSALMYTDRGGGIVRVLPPLAW